jgi:hypothetical protein
MVSPPDAIEVPVPFRGRARKRGFSQWLPKAGLASLGGCQEDCPPPITDGNDVDFAPIIQRTGEDALTCTLSSRDFIGRTGVVRHNSCRFLIRDRKSESACSQSGQPGARAVPDRHAFVMEMELL